MSVIRYVSVVDIKGRKRQIRAGKVDREGTDVVIPMPNNDLEDIQRRDWVRVGVFELPEEMPKSEFKDWWNRHKDDDPRPQVIDDVLNRIEEIEGSTS